MKKPLSLAPLAPFVLAPLFASSAGAADPAAATTKPAESMTTPFAQGVNALTTDLMKQQKADQNIFLSPLSIESALAMTSLGAKGDTLSEMQKTLHLPDAPKEMKSEEVLAQLNSSTHFTLQMANRIWLRQHKNYLADFTAALKNYFSASFAALNFAKDPEKARGQINHWVEEQTGKKITNLLPAGSITKSSEMVLTNAVYFKASWLHPFRPEATKPADFQLSDNSKLQVPFMNLSENYLYLEDESGQMIDMPYEGREVSMVVMLPKAGQSPLGMADASRLEQFLKNGKSQKVVLALPKFHLESSLDLSALLKDLGMGKAFSFQEADFSGMRKLGPKEKLAISNVFHKTFIDVNENGTEAAAATAVSMMFGASAVLAKPVVMVVNHPFAFFIYHHPSHSILFSGVMAHP